MGIPAARPLLVGFPFPSSAIGAPLGLPSPRTARRVSSSSSSSVCPAPSGSQSRSSCSCGVPSLPAQRARTQPQLPGLLCPPRGSAHPSSSPRTGLGPEVCPAPLPSPQPQLARPAPALPHSSLLGLGSGPALGAGAAAGGGRSLFERLGAQRPRAAPGSPASGPPPRAARLPFSGQSVPPGVRPQARPSRPLTPCSPFPGLAP